MQFVQLDDFLMYNFLSEVRMNPGGKGAAYIVSSADAANNGYTSDLYYLRRLERDCTSIRLSHSGKVGSYAWLDGERLAYAEQTPRGFTRTPRRDCCFRSRARPGLKRRFRMAGWF